jgi:hypothetical protein
MSQHFWTQIHKITVSHKINWYFGTITYTSESADHSYQFSLRRYHGSRTCVNSNEITIYDTHICTCTYTHTNKYTHKSTDQPRNLVTLMIYFIHSWLIRYIYIKSTNYLLVSSCLSICVSMRISVESHWTDFYEIWY